MWGHPLYLKTFLQVMTFIAGASIAVYRFRNKYSYTKLLWASLKTWIFLAPLLFILFSTKNTIILLTFISLFSIYTSKHFFQMVGMYHRRLFVIANYLFTLLLAFFIYTGNSQYYNLSPMLFLSFITLIPLIRNNAENMIQYTALCLFSFLFFAWAPLHLGHIIFFEDGFFFCLFAAIVSETVEMSCLVTGQFYKKGALFSNITKKVTLLGVLAAILSASLVSWLLVSILPFRLQDYAIAIGVAIALLSILGDLLLTMIRRDLRMKDSGVFILGRGDIIDRMDKLIFVAPFVLYVYEHSIF